MGKLMQVPISQIRPNPDALREVDRKGESYLTVAASVKDKGILNSINLRLPGKDEDAKDENGKELYILVDGLHRFTAAKEAGLDTVPALIDEKATRQDAWYNQIITNNHKVDTRPVEFSRQLQRIFASNPTLTASDMASRLNVSPKWVSDRLSLRKLSPKIGEAVNKGEIALANAFVLTRLPEEEQEKFFDDAKSKPAKEFIPEALSRISEIKKALKEGRETGESVFEAQAFMRKTGDIKQEFESGEIGKALTKQYKLKSAEEGFQMGIKFVLNMDPDSVKVQQDKWQQREQEKAERKKLREAEKGKKAVERKEAKAKKYTEEAAAAKAEAVK